MRYAACAVLVCLAGCSDPASSALPVGSAAIVYQEGSDISSVKEMSDGGPYLAAVAVGTRVVVAQDDGGDSHRSVRVNVQEGPYRGKSCLIDRLSLRPAP